MSSANATPSSSGASRRRVRRASATTTAAVPAPIATAGACGPAISPKTTAASSVCRGRRSAVTATRDSDLTSLWRSGTDLRTQRRELLRPNAGDLAEVVDAAKASVLAPVVEDLRRRRGTDAVERVEL